ncbi:MAG: hypothetical protein AABN33_22480 [Acidobacteriota bacterium]
MAKQATKRSSAKKTAPKQDALEPLELEYDPLNSGLTVLHRAGIAGLILQIKAMGELKHQASEEEKGKYLIPEWRFINDGRGIAISFTKESFYSLMRERYAADLVKRSVGKETHKRRQKKSKRYIYDSATERERFFYLEPRPSLRHFELFKAHSDWQEHARDATWQSYYCIYKTQLAFKIPKPKGVEKDSPKFAAWEALVNKEGEKNPVIDVLWAALIEKRELELRKQYYPSTFGGNLKGVSINDPSEWMLLLHFWPIVAAHFTPVSLKVEKDKKTNKRTLRQSYQSPIIVVPDVIDAGAFVHEFIDYLGRLDAAPKGKLYQDGRYIATPLEAPLAFFAAPRLARGVNRKPGTRGAEVYVFKQRPKQDKQPLVTAIVNESFSRRLVDEYKRLTERKITSLPFRALCVENLLAEPQRYLYEGFERLVEQYPIELFVATKMEGRNIRRFAPHGYGYQMAWSLYNEFLTIEKQRRRKTMNEDPTIPFLIWRITRLYIRWRACAKAEPPIDANRLKAIFARKPNERGKDDEALLKRYNAEVSEVVEKLFIDFRGQRDAGSFANAFTETLFRAPQSLSPKDAERLRPFYEDKEWESGRRLVLMAISAAGAQASSKATEDAVDDIPEAESQESELPE